MKQKEIKGETEKKKKEREEKCRNTMIIHHMSIHSPIQGE